ncbi:hypothetical protein pEaSNUABM22_00086 [Erwinia phage pEa_SNUABM_22]|uniref:Uncharacterized protein n=1 Tax=Erwinia phage pEa_SNUABM_22 TaxID=2869549 RepID=A0AAE8XRB2_9CAUD|nr:hypothetical protein MPK63_gp086 [Erwinia phage pEa_SNUABM_22]UAW96574.1 hypothetical protein pEaSNUABM22_00086 [Erwinia phage pEa_SNUABM_22]
MKIINNRIMAQAMMGTNANTAALVNDPNVGAGWNIFAFSGKLPTSKEGFDAAFNNKSLADMYNTSIGMIRNPVTGVESGNVLTLALQSQYIPKGASYYGTVGSANTVVYQLLPHRITRSGFTDRSIGLVVGSGSMLVPAARFGGQSIDVEFDNPVTVTHLKFNGTVSDGFQLVALSDDGLTETTLGTATAITGDATVLALSSPRASKKYRFKSTSTTVGSMMRILLSSVDVPSSSPATVPTWAALAHCNTLTHGDTDYSDEIMYCADAVGSQGPFKIVGDIIPLQKTIMYCPKLRFTQRSN